VKAIRPLLCLLAVSLLSILTACGGGGSGPNPTVPVVSISGQSSTVAPSGAINLTATVSGDSTNSGVSWTVSGDGTLSNSTTTGVTYTAPSTVPSSPNVTITATSVANNQGASSVYFIVQQLPVQALQSFIGQYAFVMSGFDSSGNPLTVGGSIKADGNGHITSGVIDVNDNGSNASVTTITGSYTLNSIGRGTITLSNALQAFSSTPEFSFTLDTATNTGAIISLDASLPMVSGTIDQQNSGLFGTIPSGSFIFRGFTDNPQRGSEVGRLSIVGGGAISNGLLDIADIYNGNDYTNQTFTGNSFTIPDTNGRGSFSISVGTTPADYVFYVVSATKIYFFENNNSTTGSNTQFIGQLRSQSLSSLTATSPNGPGIFGTIGGDYYVSAGVTYLLSSVAIGNLNISGAAVSANWDLNDASQVTSSNGASPVTGTVAFDPTTGRGTLTFNGGFSDGFIDSAVFYLQSSGTGVVLDTTGSGSGTYPEALVGDLTPQSTNVSAISGDAQSVELSSECDVAVFDTAGFIESDNLTALQDGSLTPCGGSGGTIADQAIIGSFSSLSSIGRSTVSLDSAYLGGGYPAVAYAIDATHFYVIQTLGTTSSQNGFDSSLAIAWTQTLPSTPTSAQFVPTKAARGSLTHLKRANVVRKSRTEAQPPRTADELRKLNKN
jgi:hypothetical protein